MNSTSIGQENQILDNTLEQHDNVRMELTGDA